MLTMLVGIPFSYTVYVVDSNNTPVDLSLATSLSLNIGTYTPIIGASAAQIGYALFPLTNEVVSSIGTFDVSVTYTLNGVTETTFKVQINIINKRSPPTVNVISGALSTVIFELKDTDGSVLDITNLNVQLFDKADNVTTPVLYTFTVLNWAQGVVSVDYTKTVPSFGYFLIDGILTSEFSINPII